VDVDVARGCGFRNGLSIQSLAQPGGGLQSGLDVGNLQQSRQSLSRALHENRQSFGIDLAHAAQVPTEVSLGDEVAQHRLIEQRRVTPRHGDRRREVRHEVLRDDQISEPQRREEHFVERAEKEHLPAGVEPLQRRNRTSRVAVFAVVVVFENQRAGAARPLQQFQPPRQRHGHPQRELMRRRGVDQSLVAQSARRQSHPLFVQRYRADLRADAFEHTGRALISGILDAHAIARIEQQPRHQIERVQHSGNDRDLLRIALHSA
jgi:hypothetical protein